MVIVLNVLLPNLPNQMEQIGFGECFDIHFGHRTQVMKYKQVDEITFRLCVISNGDYSLIY